MEAANESVWTTGDELRKARVDAHLEQMDIARLCDVSRQLVSKWERNKAVPDIIQWRKIAHRCEAPWMLSLNISSYRDPDPPRFTLIHGEGIERRDDLKFWHLPPDGVPERRQVPVAAVGSGV